MALTDIKAAAAIFLTLTLICASEATLSLLCPEKCLCEKDSASFTCPNGVPQDALDTLSPRTKILHIHGSHSLSLTNATFKDLPAIVFVHFSQIEHLSFEGDPFSSLKGLLILKMTNSSLINNDLNDLQSLRSLVTIDLSENSLAEVPSSVLSPNVNLQNLNLAQNNLSFLATDLTHQFPGLVYLNLSYNNMVDFDQDYSHNTTDHLSLITVLDLSNNAIEKIGKDAFLGFSQLAHLYLENNQLASLNYGWFKALGNLTHLSLAYNPIIALPSGIWAPCTNLQWLNISYMEDLSVVDGDAFLDLTNLEKLDLSHNSHLTYLHALTFKYLTSATYLDLRQNALTSLDRATFENMSNLEEVHLAGNPWNCNCDTHWLGPGLFNISNNDKLSVRNRILIADNFICASPPELEGLRLVDLLPTHNFSCHGARIVNFTEIAYHAIGSAAVINCVAVGDPLPHITWITPRKYVIRYLPTYVHPGRPGPQYAEFHEDHEWHNSMKYVETLADDHRIHVLTNGSLYIDYVLRADAGPYTCLVHNQFGNDSVKIHFRLDYLIIPKTMVISMIVGFIAAGGFCALALIFALIRYLAHKCSREQRQKRKSIKEILGGLETYRSDKMDKLSAYKTAKIDQLAAFKTAKVDKLRGYKNITVQSLVQYLHKSREHYANQTVKIKDNCAQQVEKVRESYSLQRLKFKDYRSHQVDKIKDNYNGQLLKIRQYGSGQLERLRDQYKLQQQHVLKLLELLDIGNCMTVIEAECLRTESMIFNSDLTFDLEAAVYMPREDSQSEYMTAGDTTDNSSEHSHTGTINFEVKLDNEIPFSNLQKAKSQSTSTLTQQKIDQQEGSPAIREKCENKETESSQASGTNGKSGNNGKSSGKESGPKTRTPRKRHRQRTQRQDTLEDEEDEVQKRPHRRRGASKERKEKREQKRVASKSNPSTQLESASLLIRPKVVRSPEEINRTLREIAVNLDKLKREPLTLSLPDLNFDLSHGIFTDDEQTPLQPKYPPSVSEYEHHKAPPKHTTNEVLSDVTIHTNPSKLREEFQQQGSNQGSIDVPSTDYESAQEPESREATPQVGYYEHTGSPHSFASFPSTPSTPTLPTEGHRVVIIKPDVDSSPNHHAKESVV